MKKVIAVLLAAGLVVSFAGCKKKEEKPQLPPGHPSTQGGVPPVGMPEVPKVERQIVVPKNVADKWTAVKLAIENKAAKSTKEYTVKVGSEQAVPDTKFSVKVLYFLPDFKMGEKEITSTSDKPNNPAAQVSVLEGGKEIWKGWIYSMHPGIHPFQHEQIGLALLGGVSK